MIAVECCVPSQAGLDVHMAAGISWSLDGLMQLTEHMGVNYITSFVRRR